MNEKQILREAMNVKHISQGKLAELAGYQYQSHIGNILARPSMRVDVLVRLLSAMGYELVIRSKEGIEMLGTNGQTYIPEWVVENGGATPGPDEGEGPKNANPKKSEKVKKAVEPDI